MGILSKNSESYEVPKWMLEHPELEPILNEVGIPYFMIHYGLVTQHGLILHRSGFSVPQILNIDYDGDTVMGSFRENIDVIANHIVETVTQYAKGCDFKFLNHVNIK